MFKKWWLKIRHSPLGKKIRCLVPNWVINSFFHLPVAFFAAFVYRYPARRLKIIGVTGTDGKTTTATLIYQILLLAEKKVALISTVSAKIGKKEIPTGFHVTSPHPWKLQALLKKIANQGYEYVVLEVTSHGLDQHRILGINFLVGVITNVTHEHLDYHETYQNYLRAKVRLFENVKIAVLNRDDSSYRFLVAKTRKNKQAKVVTYGIKKKADFTPRTFQFKTSLPGEYNQYNCLAAIATTVSLNISLKRIRQVVAGFKGVKGRMEAIKEGQDFQVIVDFAHTLNGLENALKTLKEKKPHRLIAVFGCAGLRDAQKRPKMGKIATRLANISVLTAEDPRTEDVNKIIDQIAQGCQEAGGVEKKTFFRLPDRSQAIRFAIQKLAKKGDIVVICGKGHEQSMCFGVTEYPWSDQKEARKALRSLKKDAKKD